MPAAEIYESPKVLSEYLLFHYGADHQVLPPVGNWPGGMKEALGFTQRTVSHFGGGEVGEALDLGCSVGRSTFEMARRARHVVGIDFSASFIDMAVRIRDGETVDYERLEEGRQATRLEAHAPTGVDLGRVSFQQGDAMDLPPDLGPFDRVHAANLLCRLPQPMRLLERLPSLVKPGGELVLATPCTWLEQFTPSSNWPPNTTLEWLKDVLGSAFELRHQCEEPFLIRETARKFQWSSSLVTVWERGGVFSS